MIKTGLGPIIIDLMKRGFVTGLRQTGRCLFMTQRSRLLARPRKTSTPLLPKVFLEALRKRANCLNSAAREGANDGIGLGEALGRVLAAMNPPHKDASILCASYSASIPFTAHLTIGGDIAHFHSTADGASLGATSHTDFRLLAELVRQMNDGGVYLNVGSAVVLPEVFLKCVTLVRNLGHPLSNITTANLDFIQSYRPLTNVVRRPTEQSGGHGYSITGHHEITIPLLAAELICGDTN